MNEIESEGLIMEVKRTIKIDAESFELGDVISFKLTDGEEVQAKAANTCEWIKYDYRTMCPKNHGDVDNPYWRIPTDMKHLLYCPYCGKRIRLVE